MSSHPGSQLSTNVAPTEYWDSELRINKVSDPKILAERSLKTSGTKLPSDQPYSISSVPPEPALLLLDSSLSPIYCNSEAVKILAYADSPRKGTPLERFLRSKIGAGLTDLRMGFLGEFASGKRRYVCRAFPVAPPTSPPQGTPAVAVLLERRWSWSFDASRIASQFRLSQRERQTMELLFQGFSGKEIASRLNVSPNTVKVFLRMLMMKTGVTSRSGLMGRVFGSTPSI